MGATNFTLVILFSPLCASRDLSNENKILMKTSSNLIQFNLKPHRQVRLVLFCFLHVNESNLNYF